MTPARILLVLGCCFAQGCFVERVGTAPEGDAAGIDSGAFDAALDAAFDGDSRDSGSSDAGPDAGFDAFVPTDDAGPGCTGMTPTCEGELLVMCAAGTRIEESCTASSSFCDFDHCAPWNCTPGNVECIGASEERCDSRGIFESTLACDRGCTPVSGCNPESACGLAIETTLNGPGTTRFTTCGQGDDAVFISGCTSVDISGPDLIVRFEVAVGARYRFDLLGVSGSDPVLYIRSACAAQASELECDDDDAAGLGSRIDIDLVPGDYFLVIDSFRGTDEGPPGRCGDMDLVVTTL